MQNREELRQKGNNWSKKSCCERGKNIIFRKGEEYIFFPDQNIGLCSMAFIGSYMQDTKKNLK